jgi:phytoene synthase
VISFFEQYRADRRIWRAFYRHSRTFSLAARLLPRRVQMPVATVYLFCRRVDSLADKRVLDVGADQALRELDDLRRTLNRTLDEGRPPDGKLLWQRLAEVQANYPLPRQPMNELIRGAKWDLRGQSVDDMHDLVNYANLMGGSVGALMLPFLTSKEEADRLEAPARRLGIAMQITNITRDVGEDLLDLDRLYLPRDWMQQEEITRLKLLEGIRKDSSVPAGYPQLLEFVMELAETHYASAVEAIDALPGRARLAIRGAARMYREILNEVRANSYDNLSRRAYTTLPRKLRLLVQDDYARRKADLRTQRDAPQTTAPRPA